MSHIVDSRPKIKDAAAVRAACQRLALPAPVQGIARLYSGEVEGLAVKLPDWNYPVVCDLATGQIKFDNLGGRWGNQKHLDQFLQAYAVEKAKIEARRRGHSVTETAQTDGTIKLVIEVNGGAA